jgi:hypothetical protein
MSPATTKAVAKAETCEQQREKAQKKYSPCKTCGSKVNKCPPKNPECLLSTWHPNCCPEVDGVQMTPHHVIPKHCCQDSNGVPFDSCAGYDADKAPCICVQGKGKTAQHGQAHLVADMCEAMVGGMGDQTWSYAEARDVGIYSVREVFPQCPEECIGAQLDEYHKDKLKFNDDTQLRADPWGKQAISPKLRNAKAMSNKGTP